jgi:hypothetical protein
MNFIFISQTILAVFLSFLSSFQAFATEVSFTIDDPGVQNAPGMTHTQVGEEILRTLKEHQLKAILFVCGKRVDDPEGQRLLSLWDSEQHVIANHTYSHKNYNSVDTTFPFFSNDTLKNEKIIQGYKNFKRLVARMNRDAKVDLERYKTYYLNHIWDRAQYYNNLSKKVLGREIKHNVLIHHNPLNALFLDDLIKMFKSKGWKLINAKDAFKDPAYSLSPKILPAGDSLLWALAKESEKYESELRYPGEDGDYLNQEMNQLGL